MQFNTVGDGVLVGLIAMTGVFLVLAMLSAVLFLFKAIFYREKKQPQAIAVKKEVIETGISKKKIAIISAALYYYLNLSPSKKKVINRRKIYRNETYKKLRIKRWKNG